MRNLSQSATLGGRYAVGEIADFAGVPNVYDAGDSLWMKANTWVPANTVTDQVVDRLAGNLGLIALTDNALCAELYCYVGTLFPPAVVGNTVCYPFVSSVRGSNYAALVINQDGARVVDLGLIGKPYNYGLFALTSDGTKFWAWSGNNSSPYLNARYSTDGLKWESATVTGLPALTNPGNRVLNGIDSGSVSGSGIRMTTSTVNTYQQLLVWCGARHLCVGINGSNQWLASLSHNGTTWGGDQTTAVLGASTITATINSWFHRNGNNVALILDATGRYSNDGGVTWAAMTNPPSALNQWFRSNSTDPSRILVTSSLGDTTARVSTNNGQTWTTRTLPVFGSNLTTAYGRGSTWAVCSQAGELYKSTDDGATWSAVLSPLGFIGIPHALIADANRWYLISAASNQVAVSTDLANWTIRNIANAAPGLGYINVPHTFTSLSADIVVGVKNGYALLTPDGGVTWRWASVSASETYAGNTVVHVQSTTLGDGWVIGGNVSGSANTHSFALPASALVDGGAAFVRGTSGAVTPARSGLSSYLRVA